MRSALFFFPLALLFSSCGDRSQQVTLEINLEQNGVPFEIGETLYEGDTAIKFELIHCNQLKLLLSYRDLSFQPEKNQHL